MLCRQPAYIGRVFFDVFQDKTPDVFPARADFGHWK
jgi:hypothetical protein